MGPLPHEVKVVVIGGGIAGCSTAYHLADNGWNTVLIERDVLTSGTTWHAAGMVTQLGTTPQITKIRKNSVKFYNDLKNNTAFIKEEIDHELPQGMQAFIYNMRKDIFKNLNQWRKEIGYISQNIYLLDSSIKKNIVFNFLNETIDNKKLEKAIHIASLKEKILEMPNGIETKILSNNLTFL